MKTTAAISGLILSCFSSVAFAAQDSAHADHAQAGGSGLPQFNPEWFPSQLFWLAVVFAIMYWAFSKKILPTIGGVIENRKSHISTMMAQAEDSTARAKETQDAYNKSLSGAGAQARQIMMDADASAKESVNLAVENFRQKAEKQIAEAEGAVITAQKQALQELQATIGEIARTASKQIANIDADHSAIQSAVAQAQKISQKISKAA